MTALESLCSHRDFAVKFAQTYTTPYLSSNQVYTLLAEFLNYEIAFWCLSSILEAEELPTLVNEADLHCPLRWSKKDPRQLTEKDHAYYSSDIATIELFLGTEKAQAIANHDVIRKVLTAFVDEHMAI